MGVKCCCFSRCCFQMGEAVVTLSRLLSFSGWLLPILDTLVFMKDCLTSKLGQSLLDNVNQYCFYPSNMAGIDNGPS
jgi:hypothetical protein